MSISEYNYEAYFLDYHEGKLDAAATAELIDFIARHPELKDEFESFESVTLNDFEENIQFENKQSLKKTVAAIDAKNFDELAIQYVDGALSSLLTAELLAFVKQNPTYENELALYKKTKLVADASIVFEDKESLKKESRKRPMVWYYWSAAAAVALLIAGYFLVNSTKTEQVTNLVSISHKADTSNTTQPIQQPTNNTIAPTNVAVIQKNTPLVNQSAVTVIHKTNTTTQSVLQPDSNRATVAIQNNSTTVKQDSAKPLVASVQPKDSSANKTAIKQNAPAYVSTYVNPTTQTQNKSVLSLASNAVSSVKKFFKHGLEVNRYYSKTSDKVIAYQITLGNNRYTLPIRNNSY